MKSLYRIFSLDLFFLLLTASSLWAATAPVVGTTTFNNAFSAQTTLLTPSPSPGTALNVGTLVPTGWDFTVTAPGSTILMTAANAGANPGGVADFCIRMTSQTSGISVQSVAVKSNDGSPFNLQSVYLKINMPPASTANITITGYRGGVPVPGATTALNGITTNNTAWHLFTLTSTPAFANVDQFVFTQTGTSATITFMAVDQITIGTATPLPLTLTNFSGRSEDGQVKLQWTTASEQHTRDFVIERGADGLSYMTAGQVPAAGNSNLPLNYQFTDIPPAATATSFFYRLKMSDLDGQFTYSPVLKIATQQTGGISFSVYPNPFRQQASLVITSPVPDKAMLILSDMSGKVLLTESQPVQQGNTLLALPITASLPKGVYLLTVSTSARKQTLQVVKLE